MITNHTFIERDVMNFVNRELSKNLPKNIIRKSMITIWNLRTKMENSGLIILTLINKLYENIIFL